MKLRQSGGAAIAYLAGVLHGDGYCTARAIGLHVKDLDFAETFALAIREVSTAIVKPSPDRKKYWRVVLLQPECFKGVKRYHPQSESEYASWLRGFFDSEGSAYCGRTRRWENSFNRRVGFFNTNIDTLRRAKRYCEQIGVSAEIRPIKSSNGHLGSLPVFELRLANGRDNFTRFAWLVGSSIDRKMKILRAIPLSFSVDHGAAMRAAQLIGATAKRQKTLNETLPTVLREIRKLIDSGIAPTQRNCAGIKKYGSVVSIFGTLGLARMAREI